METGMRLDDRYHLLRMIGCGSEGKVYLAIQERTQKFLAVKEVHKGQACYSSEGIQVWKRLSDPHFPQVLDLIETSEKVWIVMEYVEGVTLREWIAKYGYPSESIMYRWIFAICNTLEYLHSQQPPVIFGDLKPENIMIQKGKPILVDLGSAYVKGSKAKRTGTYFQEKGVGVEDEKRDVMCLGKTVEEILPSGFSDFHLFAKKAMGLEQDSFRDVRDCKQFLQKIQKKRYMQVLLLLVSAILLWCGCLGLSTEQRSIKNRTVYEEMTEYLDEALTDLEFTQKEYVDFLTLWGKVGEKEATNGEILSENLSDYGRICYKVGMACWYFTSGWQGEHYAEEWFLKVMELPEELQKKSESYLRLLKWKEQLKLYAAMGETESFFLQFYREMEKLDQEEEPYFQMALVKAKTMFFIHYLAELKAEGLEETEIDEFLVKGEEYLKNVEDDRAQTEKQKEEIQALISVLSKFQKELYRKKDNTWDATKEELQDG